MFFPMFNREDVLIEPNAFVKSNIVFNFVGVDYGEQNATTYRWWAYLKNGTRINLATWYYSGRENFGKELGVAVYADHFKNWYLKTAELYGNCSSIEIDPSAKALKIAIENVMGYGFTNKANNKRQLGWSIVKGVLSNGKLKILNIEENYKGIKEYENALYDTQTIDKTKTTGEDMVKINDHCLDADRYALMAIEREIEYYV